MNILGNIAEGMFNLGSDVGLVLNARPCNFSFRVSSDVRRTLV